MSADTQIMLSLADLRVLADTAERNNTRHAFVEVALQWAMKAADRIEALEAELAAVREQEKYRGRFAGWFREERSAMSYRLWTQGGADQQPGEIALYE